MKRGGTMNNSGITLKETFFVHVDGILYSEHNYFSDALKTALNVGNIFPQSHVEVVSSVQSKAKTAEAA